MPQEQLTIEVVPDDGIVTVRLSGEVDLATSPALREAVMEALGTPASTVCLDLTSVSFLDSTGLGVLVAMQRRAKGEGGSVRLVGPTGMVLRALQITGVDQLLDIECAPAAESPSATIATTAD
jgi:anti-sigma B factor antagonist